MQSYEYYDGYEFMRNSDKVQYIILSELDNNIIICYIHGYNFISEISKKIHKKASKFNIIEIKQCIKFIKDGVKYTDFEDISIFNYTIQFLNNLMDKYSNELLLNKSASKIQKQFRESITNPEYMICKKRLLNEYNNLC